ncbi:hypothetical protein [Amnibacterium kyonggiense]|nr:hypothetical protein [Amnibacterium kyonggiense]
MEDEVESELAERAEAIRQAAVLVGCSASASETPHPEGCFLRLGVRESDI